MTELTHEYIQSLFNYRDGNLYWRVPRGNQIKAGDKAGTTRPDGRCQIHINGKSYKTHRLIFLYHNGYLPEYLDHIDRNPANNTVENLREATLSQNQWNSESRKNSSSIYKGVYWYKRTQKWRVFIKINEKQIHLGYFINELEAAMVYNDKAIELFGEYAYLNEINTTQDEVVT